MRGAGMSSKIKFEFDVHYKEEQSSLQIEHATRMTEEQFLDWVKTKGVKMFYFDVFRFGREEATS